MNQEDTSKTYTYVESEIKKLYLQIHRYVGKKYGGWRVAGFDFEDLVNICVSEMVTKGLHPNCYQRHCRYTVIDYLRKATGHRDRTALSKALKNTQTNQDFDIPNAYVQECRVYKELEKDDWEEAIRACPLSARDKEVFILYLCGNRTQLHISMIMGCSEARVSQILKAHSKSVFEYLQRRGHLTNV